MNMMQNMGGMAAMNPMQAAIQGAVQNALMPYIMPQNQQQPHQMAQGWQDEQSQADEFARHLERYCHEVAEGHRAMPHAVKDFFSTAWHGAKHAVAEKFEHAGESGADFWEVIDEIRTADVATRETLIKKHFERATPVEGLVIRELANGSLIDEHARRINMKPEDFREHLKRLMKHVH